VRPFRRHQWLFLVALASFLAQTTLALTHVHARASAHFVATSSDTCTAASDEEPCSAPDPVDHGHDCALCAAISTASTLILPTPIVALATVPRYSPALPLYKSRAVAGDSPLHFQARAPPSAGEA
jgi:hypothetical protein